MQPSHHNRAFNTIGQFDASTALMIRALVNWTHRGSQAHGQLSPFGRDNGQNFQCPPPLIAPHILFFESRSPRFFRRKQSYTAHDTTSRCSNCACSAATRMDRTHTPLGTHIGKYCRGTRRSAGIDGQQLACYLVACASCLQPVMSCSGM
jgi:hypothetical protein